MQYGGNVAQRFVKVEPLQVESLVFALCFDFVRLTVCFDQLAVAVPVKFTWHSDCQIIRQVFVKRIGIWVL